MTQMGIETPFELVVLILFAISFLVQCIYLFAIYFRLLLLKDPKYVSKQTSFSVLLKVRNEEERIRKLLKQLFRFRYRSFEVVVVDDYSSDRTLEIVGSISEKNSRLRFTSINQETRYSEKISINLGLKAAKSDWVLFLPISTEVEPEALTTFNDFAAQGNEAVLGYANYLPNQGFTNGLNRLERFTNFLRSAAYSVSGMPLFFYENNVAFKKEVYFRSSGFRGMLQQYYANLELVLNEQIKKVGVCYTPFGKVVLHEKTEMQDYVNQIKKEILIRKSCNLKKRLLLLFEDLSKLIFLISFITLLVIKFEMWLYFLLLFLFPGALMFFIVKKIVVRLNEEKIFLSSFLYTLVKPLINIYHASAMYIQDRRNKWN